jgi:MoaA/NifB/PqqE/SkfB family radical SAM enzyme
MRVTLRCRYDRRPDGSYHVQPHSAALPFDLAGSAAQLLDVLVDLSARPASEQEPFFAALEPEARARLSAALARLERAGAIDVTNQDGRNALPRPLRSMHLELTHRCNFVCRACYLGGALRRAGAAARDEATTAAWQRLIADAVGLGCTSVVLTGGEPFVRRDLLAIVACLRGHGVRCEINTNASCIGADTARALFELGVWGVEVSLYGFDADSAAAYTGVPAGHAAALRGVRRLAEAGVPVQAKYFATAGTVDGYEQVRRELEPWGVPVVAKGHVIHGDIFEGRQPVGVRSHLSVPEFEQEQPLPCAPGFDGLVVEPAGDVRPCPKLGLRFGNAFVEGLEAIWERSHDLEAFRHFWVQHCRQAGFVQGGRVRNRCPAAALLARPTGLADFEADWRAFQARVRQPASVEP